MKNVFQIVTLVGLLAVLIACPTAPNNIPPNNTTPDTTPDETPIKSAFGTPVGSAVTQTFDATGGSFTEPSAGVTVKAFVDGFGSNAQVSVQPITNTLPDGIGMGVAISSSQPPKKLLIVRFGYGAEEPDPNSLRLAMQADDGSWLSLAPVKIDTVNKTISAALPETLPMVTGTSNRVKPMAALNLKRVVKYLGFYMKPRSATVKVGKSVEFVPYARVLEKEPCQSETAAGDDELATLCRPKKVVKEYPFTNNKAGFGRLWWVNGLEGGDSTNGLIQPHSSAGATYTAPVQAPSPNTVEVRFISTNAQTAQTVNLPAKVTIGANGYTVVGDFISKGYPVCLYGTADLTDHVEFELFEDTGSVTFKGGSIQNGTMKNENFVGLLSGSVVTQNSTYESNITAVQAENITSQNRAAVVVSSIGMVITSSCTAKLSTGSATDPAQNLPASYGSYSFRLDAFVNNTQKVSHGEWVYTITKR